MLSKEASSTIWYDSTWDWTQVFRAIGEDSNHYANKDLCKIFANKSHVCVYIYIYIGYALINPHKLIDH